jgi:hypothetical protein
MIHYKRFNALQVQLVRSFLNIKIAVFWYVAPVGLVGSYRPFGWCLCFHRLSRRLLCFEVFCFEERDSRFLRNVCVKLRGITSKNKAGLLVVSSELKTQNSSESKVLLHLVNSHFLFLSGVRSHYRVVFLCDRPISLHLYFYTFLVVSLRMANLRSRKI